jgi:hypothetical protein
MRWIARKLTQGLATAGLALVGAYLMVSLLNWLGGSGWVGFDLGPCCSRC